MFLGASLNPDYFSEKVNLFVALAPATSMYNSTATPFTSYAKDWPEIEYLTAKLGAYDMFNAGWMEESAA